MNHSVSQNVSIVCLPWRVQQLQRRLLLLDIEQLVLQGADCLLGLAQLACLLINLLLVIGLRLLPL